LIIIAIVCILYESEEENMPLLQVRDFPEDIYEEITFEAHRQNRTIAQQTIILIKKGLGEELSNKERRRLALERTFSRDVPQNVKIVDYVKFVREDRDR
jgi:hypothetical protein